MTDTKTEEAVAYTDGEEQGLLGNDVSRSTAARALIIEALRARGYDV